MIKARRLEWDSAFFNKEIAEVELSAGDTPPLQVDGAFDLLYVKSDFNHALLIEGYQLLFEESRMLFSKKITDTAVPEDTNICSAKAAYPGLPELYELAYLSGKYSRFKLDKNFEEELFRKLYRAWVDNSLSSRLADDAVLYKDGDRVIGFVTYKLHNDFAMIGLIAVDPSFQGKGIGSRLLNHVAGCVQQKNIREIRLPTQRINTSACAFYLKQGYSVLKEEQLKHYWKI